MNKDNQIPAHQITKNTPGVPIFPGRNTPLIQTAPPKNVPAPSNPSAPAPAAPAPKKDN